jgi:periodic tryptophan protein 2
MKFNYQLRRVCGSYYGRPLEISSSSSSSSTVSTQWSGSNVLFYHDRSSGSRNTPLSGTTPSTSTISTSSSSSATTYLISAVLNRIQIIDLQSVQVRTLPIEARSNIVYMSVSPVAPLLITVDTHNYIMLIHITRNIVLHRSKLSSSSGTHISCIPQFSPISGRYIAFGVGCHLQIWNIPSIQSSHSSTAASSSTVHEYCPMILHRTYTGCTQSITHIEWSRDIEESIVMVGSSDCSIRLYTVQTIDKTYQPIALLGHKSSLVSAYFSSATQNTNNIYSISMDGAVVVWTGTTTQEEVIDTPPIEDEDATNIEDQDTDADAAINFFTGSGNDSRSTKRQKRDLDDKDPTNRVTAANVLVKSKYMVTDRMYLQQECTNGATVMCTSYCPGSSNNNNNNSGILAIGFSSGIFGIYEMPNCVNVHTLSVGNHQKIQTCVLLQPTGSWLALGCPISQQLLVWEWQSETYILKQRGHAYGMSCMAYSPDSICIATGGEDGKIKLWNSRTGFCYVTFPQESSHTAAITGITFANDSVIITCSLDGTVKAHDLYRYRTFKTYTSPTPVQFLSLAVDSNGEIVVAGSNDPFYIYVWNIQTGQLLDIFTGHTGPICDLQFLSGVGTLVSGSWDGTVRTWDIYKGTNTNNMTTESYQHTSDVICIAVSPNKKQICSSTMNGLLSFWNIEDHKLLYEIDGRYDISGGRKINDRRTADTNMSSKYFTSVAYTPDNTCIIAGGNSKYICIYEISQQILLKKFQLSYNRSVDGILDEVRFLCTVVYYNLYFETKICHKHYTCTR